MIFMYKTIYWETLILGACEAQPQIPQAVRHTAQERLYSQFAAAAARESVREIEVEKKREVVIWRNESLSSLDAEIRYKRVR